MLDIIQPVMKKLVFSLILALVLAFPKVVKAEENCSYYYGGGVVCGTSVPAHEAVDTGIEDYPALIGVALVGGSFVLSKISKKFAN